MLAATLQGAVRFFKKTTPRKVNESVELIALWRPTGPAPKLLDLRKCATMVFVGADRLDARARSRWFKSFARLGAIVSPRSCARGQARSSQDRHQLSRVRAVGNDNGSYFEK
jgi:hypothetical protein